MDNNGRSEDDSAFTTTAELYFLIQKFLSSSPLQETYKVLREELEKLKLLPKRIDWEGNKHDRKVDDMERQFPHLRPDYLLQLCSQIGSLTSNSTNKISLLSLNNRTENAKKEYEHNFKQLWNYVTRYHGVPLKNISNSCNIVNILRGREFSEPLLRNFMTTPRIYSSLQIQRKTVGHLSAVYCLLFDHSGRYIITGADDLLIKLWSSRSGRLITSFRGASSEITDIAVNPENTLLAAGSIDRILRVWNLQTGVPVAVLVGHNGMITSLNFCPTSCWDMNYLISTSTDGSVAFWSYTTDLISGKVQFRSNPILYQEKIRPGQAQMICSSFSPGGTFLATGSADHHVRVYYMKGDEGPQRILEIEAHTDRVDSIQWAHSGLRFLSGSKDGSAVIWHFETQQWKSHCLNMTTKLPNSKKPQEETKKLKVTMVGWDHSDNWVITAVSDYTLKVWRTSTGELEKVLTGHTDEVYVLESHPHDPNIILSAGHDGQLFVWDLLKGEIVARFLNSIEGQGYGAIFDVKWSPDGYTIAASDSHGHILIFGFGPGDPLFEQLPKELFFHTDYRPLVRDANHHVLDEQTQVPPHMMPPPFLVDIDGNPYPPMLQRLVPGREHCKTEQLVPNIVVGNEGTQEVIQGLSEDQPLDRMIALLAQEDNEPRNHVLVRSTSRRNGEGIRQSTGEWQKDPNIKWKKHILVQPLKPSVLKKSLENLEALEKMEVEEYHRELCRRPHMITTTATSDVSKQNEKKKHRQAAYQTRRARNQNTAEEQVHHSEDSESSNLAEENDDSDFSETSGYSDWVAEEGVNLEPPKRSKRRQVNQNCVSYVSEEEIDIVAEPGPSKKTNQPESSTSSASKYKLNNGEVPEIYKPSEWLSETKPKKTPYYPQMGDELVYFMQGHHLYLEAVKAKKIYEINNKDLPWTKLPLKDHEYVKVIGIIYEIKPPRLCCLKLAILDDEGHLTGKVFKVKYHDMPDVLDFMVLKQIYQTAMSRNWQVGDKFRCMIEDAWWIGEILSHSCACEDFPDSSFLCYEIKWANGEIERMSPWDMEPIDESRKPENEGEAVPVLKEEMESILYHSNPEDWPNTDINTACHNILEGLAKIMELAIAEPFLVPVDLNAYPSYAYLIEYPIDLSTIKARFENKFYRRVTSAQFDVRYLATNAEKFNERHSVIVKHANIIMELCLRVIKQCATTVDVPAMYHQLVNNYHSTDTEDEVEIAPSTSRNLNVVISKNPRGWKVDAQSLLNAIWSCEDSVPFRTPVNTSKYPDYLQKVDRPMDLSTVKDNLANNKYKTPLTFCRDMRLIFRNSRTYNTNKRSRIYVMTVRLSAIFEEHVKKIIHNWKKAKAQGSFKQRKRRNNSSSSSSEEDEEGSFSESCSENTYTNVIYSRESNSEDSDDTDENTPLKQLQSAKSRSNTICKEVTVNLTPHSYNRSESSQSYKSSRKKSQNPSLTEFDTEENSTSLGTSTSSTVAKSNHAPKNNHVLENNQGPQSTRGFNNEPTRTTKTSSDSDSDLSDEVTLSKYQKNYNSDDTEDSYKPAKSEKSHSASSSGSEASFRPQRKTRRPRMSQSYNEDSNERPRRRITKKQFSPNSEESSQQSLTNLTSTRSFSSDSFNSDDSDDQPLSMQMKQKVRRRNASRENNNDNFAEAGPSSFSRTRSSNNKRRRIRKYHDSDSEKEVYVKRFKDNSDGGVNFTSVSSRGRVRKLTARARALVND